MTVPTWVMFVVVCVSLISILRSWLLLFGRPAAQDLIARHDVNRSCPIRDDRSPRSLSGMRQVVLLRGVNVGGRNKLAMPALRAALAHAGMENVTTYVQSGNVVLDSAAKPDALARACEAVIAERFGLQVAAVARTRAELAAVVAHDPLGGVAESEKLYQVTFCAKGPDEQALATVAERAVE